MGIYIPDIKLPKDEPGAFQVIVMYVGADRKLRAECDGTHEVTIVPPHGKLGDLDALIAVYERQIERHKEQAEKEAMKGTGYTNDMYIIDRNRDIISALKAAPTIIPADPAEEGE